MSRADDQTAYEDLVRRHAADLYRFAYRLVGGSAAAEELVQETYYQAWRSIGSLPHPDAGRTWLLTILRRHWGRSLRREARGPVVGRGDPDDTASPLPGPDLELLARKEGLQAALDRLDARFKEPFLLVFLTGLSCREVAERLSLPLGTVLSRIHRARGVLRVYLRELREGAGPAAGDAQTRFGGGR